ncbi:hypothetical protein QMK19_33140 [Streptomyces sp. H10-C2]|uniref:hypothetical protein n=1 Tax=unclassified Streptomyces TaxID=2593676 RepID=UPI0024BA47EA|nr:MULTISPECIES: hypothetical protein [unclassified Streptomyces]MDJ0346546.1 hypothetical protein [Streptomyces sp. PH10-H1]MDJ0374351.1 hypothetical protein [Streptomyces sp. H10-C2]
MFSTHSWGATEQECAASYPCDEHLPKPYLSFHRAIDVDAPVPLTFRWLCQVRTGAYTYGRLHSSSRTLTPGAENLAIGQRFLAFDLVDFEPGSHLTGVTYPAARRAYGVIAVTYQVVPRATGASRLVVRLNAAAPTGLARIRASVLAVGDTVIMRKQLLTLKALAERDAAAPQ